MRVIQLQIPVEQRETVREILDGKHIDHIVTDATSEWDDVVVVQFPVPMQAVEDVLEEFRDAGVDVDDRYRANLNAEIARAENLEPTIRRLLSGTGNYIAREELRQRAREMTPSRGTYHLMTTLGTVVATCGLLLDSAAVVVGSMVIAPQLGSALTASVGIATNDREMIARGLSFQLAGLGYGLLGAAVFGLVLRWTMVVPPVLDIGTIAQIGSRTSPGLLSVTVGLAAGTGAAFSLATHDTPSGPLVGVMVSAALIPAAATAGIGIAWHLPHVVVGSLVLLVVNVVCINLAGPVVLWILGYRPPGWGDAPVASVRTVARHAPSLVTVGLLVTGMVGAAVVVGQQVSFEQQAKSSVIDVLERDEYADVELRDVQTEYTTMGLTDHPHRVTLVISTSDNGTYPELGTTIRTEIRSDTGISVTVETEYVTLNETVGTEAEPTRTAGEESGRGPTDHHGDSTPPRGSSPRSVGRLGVAPAAVPSGGAADPRARAAGGPAGHPTAASAVRPSRRVGRHARPMFAAERDR